MKYLLLTFWLLCLPGLKLFSQNASFPPGFAAVQVATGLDPVAFALAPDGRVFIVEKFGRVMIVENGVLRNEPFLELEVDSYTERGMSGIALDPDFDTNHFVYIYYTVKNEGHNRVSRFTADGNFAAPGSEVVLLDLDPLSGPYHNAGALAFGNDGKLYIATGDGFDKDNAKSKNSTLGKILRINPDGSIPSDNPFFGETTGNNRAIWAMGFRNPFAMTIDAATGRIFATDVGSDQFEEVNEIEKGKNYGWPDVEGKLVGSPPANYKDPVFAYDHDFGCAAVGVTLYNPAVPMFPAEYEGKVFFSEHCNNRIYTLSDVSGDVQLFAENLRTPLNLHTAPDGTLYILDRNGTQSNYATNTGSLWRVFYTGSDAPFVSIQPQPVLVPIGEETSFRVAAAGASPMSFQWQKDGVDIVGATDDTLFYQNPMLSDSGSMIRCMVTNPSGMDTSQTAELRVTSSHRPVPGMFSPAEGDRFRGGEWLHLLGQATDAEDGVLGASRFRWRVDFHHVEHSHPAFGPVSETTEEFYQIPAANEVSDDIWYRVHLTVTDISGLSASVARDVLPIKTNLVVQTSPQGFPILVDGHKLETPDTVVCVSGVLHQIDAPKSHVTLDSVYLFEKWATGETSPTLLLPVDDAGLNLRAIYKAARQVGTGEGLTGYYYDRGMAGTIFEEPYLFNRIDSAVNFNWGYGSPDTAGLGLDRFLIRWEGWVQPFFDEKLSFHLFIHTDGARLWVNNEKLIDRWYTSPTVEQSASIDLKGGLIYPIKLEYNEQDGQAICQLLWSSDKLARDFIPKSQLYSAIIVDSGFTVPYRIFALPNPVQDVLEVVIESSDFSNFDIELYNLLGELVLKKRIATLPGRTTVEIEMSDFANGLYLVKVYAEDREEVLKIFKY
ncbi:MAG: PQQ-dependent sugar dehydrogenase [Saprospiraceae bacterium]|nr:PQQ-dependent sugar dehydrogenase [Saprospiraceae bacterium]MCF8250486.1 PQQ-dependent sugar dehydrogenase [Saprospiraceae bacterium]MCF8281991.1 PQQ-dependent sugar dehydrogenase [Bacteroidales bacterium]MCF8312368.1 PQQ-dependent sugar dehydrogenase [Saprospiraceae bacterium]MCF8440635.1 PQQ-dependent sugar dehydrogenase [Saprospiraceae bacterium]